jgi:hypothetical protein
MSEDDVQPYTPTPPAQEVSGAIDYFACDETYKVMLPDNIQWLECKTLNEGDRKRYQSKVNRDLTIKKSTGDAQLRLSQGEERHELINAAVIGWNVMRGGKPVPFSSGSTGSTLTQFINAVPPAIVDHIFKQISEREPWLNGDISIEDIDEQMKQLQELRDTKVKEKAGNVI